MYPEKPTHNILYRIWMRLRVSYIIPDVCDVMKNYLTWKDPGKSDKFLREKIIKILILKLPRCFISGSDFKTAVNTMF